MRKLTANHQRGDTLVEVLIAMAALATVVSLFYSIMQNSYAQGQIALERTVTQARMNGQAAMLREAQARAVAGDATTWTAIVARVNVLNAPAIYPTPRDETACVPESERDATRLRFYLEAPDAGGVQVRATEGNKRSSSYPIPGDGMWIEGFKIGGTQAGGAQPYYAFYLKGCWTSSFGGQDQAMRTIVRLYDML